MSQKYAQTWDLDTIYDGGSDSLLLQEQLEDLELKLPLLKKKVTEINPDQEAVEEWNEVLNQYQQLAKKLYESWSFVSCLTAQNVKDQKAKLLTGRMTQIEAYYQSLTTAVESKLSQMPHDVWEKLIAQPHLQSIAFNLKEIRQKAKDKLSPEQEELASDLSVDGYHAWSDLYYTIVGRIQIPFEEDGKTGSLSVGQAANKLSDPDRQVRREVFKKWEEAWQKEADLCAAALNHIAGFRLQLYKHRNWDNVLKEPLEYNRMKEETLQTMWDVIQKEKHRMVKYLDRKAKLLGTEQLSWYDIHAPLPGDNKKVSYDEAADFIVEQFRKFSPDMADFAQLAFDQRWIEAEDRPGKRPGGFCTSFPVSEQTRIFMTYAGTASNVSTLAHELGHGYHQHVMNDLPALAQEYAMNVAETASTFAELIVIDAAIKQATTREEKVILLEDKLQRALSFFMDIHSRFLFETRFYEARKQGPISAEEISKMMVEAQKEGFAGALEEYHPHFWASKLHFYATGVPFYNFPYTFGYLFSTGIYARALEEGSIFAQKYVDLLRDTASMTVEELAMKHLGVDLTQPDFWKSAVDLALTDVDEFLALTN